MATTPDDARSRESDGNTSLRPQRTRTWFPILLGVLCGMIAFVLVTMVETPALYTLTAVIFDETSPKALFGKPAYFCVHRMVLLALAAIGGTIGAVFSEWRKRTSFLFLFATLLVIAAFAAMGFH